MEIYTREKERIEDVHVTGWADGRLKVHVEVTKGIRLVDLEVIDANDRGVLAVDGIKVVNGVVDFETEVLDPALWSAEDPNLYTLTVRADTRKEAVDFTEIPFASPSGPTPARRPSISRKSRSVSAPWRSSATN